MRLYIFMCSIQNFFFPNRIYLSYTLVFVHYFGSHPLVSTECTDAVRRQYLAENGGKDVLKDNNDKSLSFEAKMAHIIATSPPMMVTVPGMNESSAERISVRLETKSIGRARLLRSNIVDINTLGRSQVKPMSPSSMAPAVHQRKVTSG